MKILIVSGDRTLISGHPQNLGDAFLTDALAAEIRRAGHIPLIVDFGVADRIESTEERVSAGGLRGFARLVRDADAVVIGGGTLLADDQPERLFAGLPRVVFLTGLLTGLGRTPLAVFGVGCDPIERRRARLALRVGLRAARLWMRDTESAERAADYSRHPVGVAADVSFFAADDLRSIAGNAAAGNGAIVALNRRHAPQATAAQIDRLEAAFGPVTFLSMDQGDDADTNHFGPGVNPAAGSGPVQRSWLSAVEAIADSHVVVASRMHAMYMGVMLSKRVVAIGGAVKVDTFISEFGVEDVTSLGGVSETGPARTQHAVAAAEARLRTTFQEMVAWFNRCV